MTTKNGIEISQTTLDLVPDSVDVSQLMRNLSLTPEERLIEHQAALNLVLELEKAGRELREQSQ